MQLRFLAPVLASAMLASACASSAPRALPSALPEGETFSFRLNTLEGRSVSASDLRGRVVLVDVWATWCAPCEESFPFYARLHRELSPKGFQVVAVSIDERAEDVELWLRGRNLPFLVVHDPEKTIPERIGLRTMPSAILLDREGRVVGAHAGFEKKDEVELERMIRSQLTN